MRTASWVALAVTLTICAWGVWLSTVCQAGTRLFVGC